MGNKTWLGIAAAIAASGALLAAPAQARTSVAVSIGVPAPVYGYGYGYAQPVYAQPVYTQPYVVAQPGYVVSEPYVYVSPGYRRGWGHHHGYRRDSDHDGVPDRFDRRPYNPRRY